MKRLHKYQLAANRKEAIAQGAYDGRFAPKVIKNKKKEKLKRSTRNKVKYNET